MTIKVSEALPKMGQKAEARHCERAGNFLHIMVSLLGGLPYDLLAFLLCQNFIVPAKGDRVDAGPPTPPNAKEGGYCNFLQW